MAGQQLATVLSPDSDSFDKIPADDQSSMKVSPVDLFSPTPAPRLGKSLEKKDKNTFVMKDSIGTKENNLFSLPQSSPMFPPISSVNQLINNSTKSASVLEKNTGELFPSTFADPFSAIFTDVTRLSHVVAPLPPSHFSGGDNFFPNTGSQLLETINGQNNFGLPTNNIDRSSFISSNAVNAQPTGNSTTSHLFSSHDQSYNYPNAPPTMFSPPQSFPVSSSMPDSKFRTPQQNSIIRVQANTIQPAPIPLPKVIKQSEKFSVPQFAAASVIKTPSSAPTNSRSLLFQSAFNQEPINPMKKIVNPPSNIPIMAVDSKNIDICSAKNPLYGSPQVSTSLNVFENNSETSISQNHEKQIETQKSGIAFDREFNSISKNVTDNIISGFQGGNNDFDSKLLRKFANQNISSQAEPNSLNTSVPFENLQIVYRTTSTPPSSKNFNIKTNNSEVYSNYINDGLSNIKVNSQNNCNKCGALTSSNGRFCQWCGNQLQNLTHDEHYQSEPPQPLHQDISNQVNLENDDHQIRIMSSARIPIVAFSPTGYILTCFPKTSVRYLANTNNSRPVEKNYSGPIKLTLVKHLETELNISNWFEPLIQRGLKQEMIRKRAIDYLSSLLGTDKNQNIDSQKNIPTDYILLLELLKEFVENCQSTKNLKSRSIIASDFLTKKLGILQFKTNGVTNALYKFLLCGDLRGAVASASSQGMWAEALIISSKIDQETWATTIESSIKCSFSNNTHSESKNNVVFSPNIDNTIYLSSSVHQSSNNTISTKVTKNLINFIFSLLGGSESINQLFDNQDIQTSEEIFIWRPAALMCLLYAPDNAANCLVALGDKLGSLDKDHAAAICFLLAASLNQDLGGAIFNSIGTKSSVRQVLLAFSHRKNLRRVFKDIVSFRLTEIYEFILASESPDSPLYWNPEDKNTSQQNEINSSNSRKVYCWIPHLQFYKLRYARNMLSRGEGNIARAYISSTMHFLEWAVAQKIASAAGALQKDFYSELNELHLLSVSLVPGASSGNSTSSSVSSLLFGGKDSWISRRIASGLGLQRLDKASIFDAMGRGIDKFITGEDIPQNQVLGNHRRIASQTSTTSSVGSAGSTYSNERKRENSANLQQYPRYLANNSIETTNQFVDGEDTLNRKNGYNPDFLAQNLVKNKTGSGGLNTYKQSNPILGNPRLQNNQYIHEIDSFTPKPHLVGHREIDNTILSHTQSPNRTSWNRMQINDRDDNVFEKINENGSTPKPGFGKNLEGSNDFSEKRSSQSAPSLQEKPSNITTPMPSDGLISIVKGFFWRKSNGDVSNVDNKAGKANLGEENTFYFDKELGRWVDRSESASMLPKENNGDFMGSKEPKTVQNYLQPPPMGKNLHQNNYVDHYQGNLKELSSTNMPPRSSTPQPPPQQMGNLPFNSPAAKSRAAALRSRPKYVEVLNTGPSGEPVPYVAQSVGISFVPNIAQPPYENNNYNQENN